MRIVILMFVAVVGWGQPTIITPRLQPVAIVDHGPGPQTTVQTPCASCVLDADGNLPLSKYLVEYTTSEKCRDCNYAYAIVCLDDADCNVPRITISHFVEFASVKEALAYINNGMKPVSPVGMYVWSGNARPAAATFVRLLSFTEVPVVKDEQVTREPQPAKEIRTIRYHAGDEYGMVAGPDVGVTGTLPSLTGHGYESITTPGAIVTGGDGGSPAGYLQLTRDSAGAISGVGKPGQYLAYDQEGNPKWVDAPILNGGPATASFGVVNLKDAKPGKKPKAKK